MHRIIATFTLVLFILFNPGNSKAAVPLAAIPLAAIGTLIIGAGLSGSANSDIYSSIYTSGKNAVNQAGEMAAKVWAVQQVVNTSIGDYVFAKAAAASINIENAWDWIKDHAAQFPSLFGAGANNETLPPAAVGKVYQFPYGGSWVIVGDYLMSISTPGKARYVNSCDTLFYNEPDNIARCLEVVPNTFYLLNQTLERIYQYKVLYYSPSGCSPGVDCSGTELQYGPAWYVDPTSLPPAASALDIPGFVAALPLDESTADEIDTVIADLPQHTNLWDTDNPTLALGGSQPLLTPATNADIEAAALDLSAQIAQSHADTLQAVADANPDDSAYSVAALEAQALADQAALEASQAVPATTTPGEVITPDPLTRGEIDWSPLIALKDLALTKFPFSLVNTITNFFDSWVVAPVAPGWDWNVLGTIKRVDLSSFDPYAATMRIFIAFFFHTSVVVMIVRRWS